MLVPVTSALLDHRQDVAGRILEPGDRRAAEPEDALVVDALVPLELDADAGQLIDRRLDVVHREVQDGVLGRYVLLTLRVHQHLLARGQLQMQHAVLLRHRNLQRLGVELLGRRHVVHGEAAERVCRVEHEGSFRATSGSAAGSGRERRNTRHGTSYGRPRDAGNRSIGHCCTESPSEQSNRGGLTDVMIQAAQQNRITEVAPAPAVNRA